MLAGPDIVVSVNPVNVVVTELRSAGVNVNTPVELLYANAPLPLALAVVTLKSVNAIPPPPPDSAALTHAVPLYFSTWPFVAPDIVVSVKLTTLAVPLEPLFVIVIESEPAFVVSVIPEPATNVNTSVS